ncbi:MAG TPA: MBOAT family O-acyltransferase [Bryobacteraceae bacterium]|nr:MBOAT family O-acyltransferase [Bryobacteraceae bacterium]
MSFDAFPFWIFLLAVWVLYLVIPGNTARKALLIAASYLFYASWAPSYLILLAGVTAGSYWVGAAAGNRRRRAVLVTGVGAAVGLLAIAKSWLHPLPVGISFYVLQAIAYMVDRYRGHLPAPAGLFDYTLHISFFPRLTAGPIVRADEFLPQLIKRIPVSSAMVWEALVLVTFGLFKKLVIADNLALAVNPVFADPHTSGSRILLATYAFAVQIYCDFSGYSDIAIGTARLFGYRLPMNFNWPYLARNPADFWRRWHISLSNWLRDYVYFSLPGLRAKSRIYSYLNLCMTMLVCGIWHGARWPYIVWGGYHGVLLAGYQAIRAHRGVRKAAGFRGLGSVLLMQQLAVIGWIFFRVNRLSELPLYANGLLRAPFFTGFNTVEWTALVLLGAAVLLHVFAARYAFTKAAVARPWHPWVLIILLLSGLATIVMSVPTQTMFLYFRF